MHNREGLDGYIWWKGVVEDRKDPLKIGRLRVRIFGWHTQNKTELPTDELPWSTIELPVDHFQNVVGAREGDWVRGYFSDGVKAQYPVVCGIVLGIPEKEANKDKGFFDPRTQDELNSSPREPADTQQHDDGSGSDTDEQNEKSAYPDKAYLNEPKSHRIQRNEKIAETIIQKRISNVDIGQRNVPTADHPAGTGTDVTSPSGDFSEEESPYGAEYPYNHVFVSESGHVREIDDTTGKERISETHRSGTFYEIHPTGLLVKKIVDNFILIVLRSWYVHVEAFALHTIDKGMKLFVNKDRESGNNYDVTIGEGADLNLTVLDGKFNVHVKHKDINLKGERDLNLEIDENCNITIHNNVNLTVEGDVNAWVKKDFHSFIDGDMVNYVGGNRTDVIIGNLNTIVNGNKNDTTIGDNTQLTAGGTTRSSGGNMTDQGLGTVQRIALTSIDDFAPLMTHTGVTTTVAGILEAIPTNTAGTPGNPNGSTLLETVISLVQQISVAVDNPTQDNIALALAIVASRATSEAQSAVSAGTGFAGTGGAGGSGGSGSGSSTPGLPLVGVPVGFLWKPISDSTGKLAVLVPAGAGVVYVSGSAGDYGGNGNGGRDHYRFPQSGGAYGMNVNVTFGSNSVIIPDGSLRYEGVGNVAPEEPAPVE